MYVFSIQCKTNQQTRQSFWPFLLGFVFHYHIKAKRESKERERMGEREEEKNRKFEHILEPQNTT